MNHRKRDWFPIVATDFFCGLLGVVVVLDAATPRAVADAATFDFLNVSLDAQGNDCRNFIVGLSYQAGQRFDFLIDDFESQASRCVKRLGARSTGDIGDMRLRVAAAPVDTRIDVALGRSTFTCEMETEMCRP